MPPIFVWAVVTDARSVLLVPARQADGWMLPGGVLLDSDETVEDALLREIERQFGVRLPEEPEFLDTQYERRQDGTTLVHNLFHVPSADLGSSIVARQGEIEWLDMDGIDGAPLPAWLRQGLGTLLGDEAEADVSLDLAEFQAAVEGLTPTAPVFIITGPAGAGKSSVARELCRRFPRAAHVDVDTLRFMVRSGFVAPVPGEPDEGKLGDQLRLALANATDLARNFSHAGFVAVIDDVISSAERLDDYLTALGPGIDARLITLLPDAPTLAARDAERQPDSRLGAGSETLRRTFAANGETRGLRLDTSALSVKATVDTILDRLREARVAPAWEDA